MFREGKLLFRLLENHKIKDTFPKYFLTKYIVKSLCCINIGAALLLKIDGFSALEIFP